MKVSAGSLHKTILPAAALCLLCTGVFLLWHAADRAAQASERIAGQILRFHVVANSDSEEDQALKLRVRDALLTVLKQSGAGSRDDAETYIRQHTDELVRCAEAVIAEAGFSSPVRLSLGERYFPTKSYGDLTFPCGTYEALQVTIGDGAGKNWWCVLYPPLCFVDVTTGVVPDESREELQEVLTDEDYAGLAGQSCEVQFRFRLLEWWKALVLH